MWSCNRKCLCYLYSLTVRFILYANRLTSDHPFEAARIHLKVLLSKSYGVYNRQLAATKAVQQQVSAGNQQQQMTRDFHHILLTTVYCLVEKDATPEEIGMVSQVENILMGTVAFVITPESCWFLLMAFISLYKAHIFFYSILYFSRYDTDFLL